MSFLELFGIQSLPCPYIYRHKWEHTLYQWQKRIKIICRVQQRQKAGRICINIQFYESTVTKQQNKGQTALTNSSETSISSHSAIISLKVKDQKKVQQFNLLINFCTKGSTLIISGTYRKWLNTQSFFQGC